MALIFGSVTGLVQSKLHLNTQNHNRSTPVDHKVIRSVASKQNLFGLSTCKYIYGTSKERANAQSGATMINAACCSKKFVCAGRNQHHFYHDDFAEDPFWLKTTKEAFGALKSLSSFLLEQPSQLRYIEWPSFPSTLKTATLTMILVALLIVALASVDSALGLVLAMFLRKPA